jgi:hypothetical protein
MVKKFAGPINLAGFRPARVGGWPVGIPGRTIAERRGRDPDSPSELLDAFCRPDSTVIAESIG